MADDLAIGVYGTQTLLFCTADYLLFTVRAQRQTEAWGAQRSETGESTLLCCLDSANVFNTFPFVRTHTFKITHSLVASSDQQLTQQTTHTCGPKHGVYTYWHVAR